MCLPWCWRKKCAAGVLIPDDCYDKYLDSSNWGFTWSRARRYLADNPKVPRWLVSDDNVCLIATLQSIHDHTEGWENPDIMMLLLTQAAQKFELDDYKVFATVVAIFPGYTKLRGVA